MESVGLTVGTIRLPGWGHAYVHDTVGDHFHPGVVWFLNLCWRVQPLDLWAVCPPSESDFKHTKFVSGGSSCHITDSLFSHHLALLPHFISATHLSILSRFLHCRSPQEGAIQILPFPLLDLNLILTLTPFQQTHTFWEKQPPGLPASLSGGIAVWSLLSP